MHATATSDLQAQLDTTTEALRKSEERALAGQLALEMMHEIKNPLEALGHIVYLAAEEADQPAEVRRYMVLAREQMTTLADIASQSLGLARSAAAPRSIDLLALAEAALRIHQRVIDAKQICLIKDLHAGAIARVYSGEMLQVISNLIVNALDALPSAGTLTLRLRKHTGCVHVLVADNGHGIPVPHAAKIFQPFFTTKDERGTGLGLALCKKIVERHKGHIVMRSSVCPGRTGTTFRVRLPA